MIDLSLHMPCSLEQIKPCSNNLCKSFIVDDMANSSKENHPTAKRLLEIGMARGAKDFTEITKALDGSDQSATNWKKRGVPKQKIIEAAKKYGANVAYIQDGVLPKFLSPSGKYTTTIDEVISLMLVMAEPGQWMLLERAKVLASEHPLKNKQAK